MPTLLQSWLANYAKFEAHGRKLAIISGPGGNAGIISSGLIAAMIKTGSIIPNAHYIGTSVGAYNWLYLLIGNDYNAATVYGRYYCDSRFINPWRLLTRRPVLNLDFVLQDVAEKLMPINYTATANSPFTVSALTTNAEGNIHLQPLTKMHKSAVQAALRATAAMPWLGRTSNLDQLQEWDGWLVEHQLLPHLKQEGITDVIWFLNRPLVEPQTHVSNMLWRYIVSRFKHVNTPLIKLIHERMAAGNFLNNTAGINLEVHYPHINIPANTRNAAQIFHTLGTSYRHMATYLGYPNLPYPSEWNPYRHYMP